MADMHILAGGGDTFRVATHFAVPNQDNAVGVSYRTALVNSGQGGTTSMVEGAGAGQITTVEKAQIEAGEVVEHVESLRIEWGPDATAADVRTFIRHFYARRSVAVLKHLQDSLKYFGHTESAE